MVLAVGLGVEGMAVSRSGGGLDKLRAKLAQVEKTQLQVGFFDSSKYPDGTPVAYVAAIQEYGYPAGNIPARPFFRPTIEAQRAAWLETLQRGYKAVIADRISLSDMLNQVGALAAGQIKMAISQVSAPPLSPATIAARQARRKSPGVSTKPLVDTGYMISQVNHSVTSR